MTHTKIVAVRATLVGFLFRKQVWIRETILVKMNFRNPTKIERTGAKNGAVPLFSGGF